MFDVRKVQFQIKSRIPAILPEDHPCFLDFLQTYSGIVDLLQVSRNYILLLLFHAISLFTAPHCVVGAAQHVAKEIVNSLDFRLSP